MTTLYLVRHGETVDNARQIMQGQTQGQLNDEGRRQAEKLAKRLAGEHFDAIIASDLRRAVQTAEILALPHALGVVTTPLLRERDWGDFTGRFIPDLRNEAWPPNVESLEAMMHRASQFLDLLRNDYGGQRVLAVEHGIINKAIQAVFYGKQMSEIEKMKNAEVRILDISLN
ncbi:MAG: histidine phosphatase family protein [Prevotella sp.]|nr:histidine phosphatase family protein [Prevotella sp.]